MLRVNIGPIRAVILLVAIASMHILDIKANAAPHFHSDNQTVRVTEGGNANLPCIVEDLGNNAVVWTDPHMNTLTYGKSIIPASNRDEGWRGRNYPRVGNGRGFSNGNWSIVLNNANRRHSGEYRCNINTTPALYKTVTLDVQYHPVMEGNDGRSSSNSEDVRATEGDYVVLECSATGNPTPNLTWYRFPYSGQRNANIRADKKIGEGNTLTLSEVKLYDSAYYRCVADNGILDTYNYDQRRSAQKTIQLYVISVPVLDTKMTTIGPNVYLDCKCETLSDPNTFSWYRNQAYARGVVQLEMKEVNEYGIYTHTRVLVLRNNTASGVHGSYKCKARTSGGEAEKTITL